jgi:hypothetical protein
VNKFKRHLSVANVLSCIALFVALSATAVAATKLKTSQVKAVNIANEAVTSAKLKKLAVSNAKLGKEAVTEGKIKKLSISNPKLGKESVTSGKLKKKAVTANILGPEAVTAGKLGGGSISAAKLSPSFYLQLLKNVTYVTETSINDSATSKAVTATCPVGKEILGGGARINGGGITPTSGVVINESAPVVAANNGRIGWVAGGREIGSEELSWQVVAYAVCAEL